MTSMRKRLVDAKQIALATGEHGDVPRAWNVASLAVGHRRLRLATVAGRRGAARMPRASMIRSSGGSLAPPFARRLVALLTKRTFGVLGVVERAEHEVGRAALAVRWEMKRPTRFVDVTSPTQRRATAARRQERPRVAPAVRAGRVNTAAPSDRLLLPPGVPLGQLVTVVARDVRRGGVLGVLGVGKPRLRRRGGGSEAGRQREQPDAHPRRTTSPNRPRPVVRS